ncbi:MAG: flavoprotein [Paenibacillaceae bacterium]|jgi:predicted Rossmann fold flavoprotein|nr:flavoprotein [Paenibacillaceae bacterium]
MKYDVIVAGGGPSGLMAAIAAADNGARVLLMDKGDQLGRKLGISGGGRCNVTNAKEPEELIRHIPGNGRFLHSALAVFGSREIIAFFEELGIKLKEEDRGRMFPVSDKAKTVVEALVRKAEESGVELMTNSPVSRILYEEGRVIGVKPRNEAALSCRAVILATGGKSVPRTGSTGDGYVWAEAAGHTITELYPTEVPLTSAEGFIRSRELQGLSLRDVAATVWSSKGKRIVTHEGDLLFTHFGLSGPVALRCSQFVVKELKQADSAKITIDLRPGDSEEAVRTASWELAATEPKKQLKNVLKGYVPERLVPLLLAKAGLAEELTWANLPKLPWTELARLIKAFPVVVNGTLSLEEAFVTGGGVYLKEVDPGSMGSKLMAGLYFCGEILDIHGYTGGYNITAAFSTGYTAGRSAAAAAAEVR